MRIIELCTMNIGKVPRKPLIHECDFDSGLVNGN